MLHNLEKKRNIDAIILVGGYGKRLRSAAKGKAKPLVKINNQIFLEILIKKLKKYKFKRIILTVFYKSIKFKEFVKKRN
jgi:D-glycero-alpha-D-manno-heptose 1-phosphate guanylyltransferase